jgi:hypothetical protein
LAAAVSNNGTNQLRKVSRKIEKWSDIISQLNIDVSNHINYITANAIME